MQVDYREKAKALKNAARAVSASDELTWNEKFDALRAIISCYGTTESMIDYGDEQDE